MDFAEPADAPAATRYGSLTPTGADYTPHSCRN